MTETPKIDLRSMMQSALDLTLDFYRARPDKEAAPTWFLLHEDGKVRVLMTPWDSEAEKVAVCNHMHKLIGNDRAIIAYAFLSETWFVIRDSEQEMKECGPPSEQPDRQEALYIIGQDISGKQLSVRCIIGEDRKIGAPEWEENMHLEGRTVIPLNTVAGRA